MDRPKRSATAAVSHVGLNGGAHSLFHLGCFRDHLVAEKAPKGSEFGIGRSCPEARCDQLALRMATRGAEIGH
jgi:hypothetical protein